MVPRHAIKELDGMALAADLPEPGLAVGDVGAVIHVFESGLNYRVEFTTPTGNSPRLRL